MGDELRVSKQLRVALEYLNMAHRTHKDLNSWQRAIEFVTMIYEVTQSFPDVEKDGNKYVGYTQDLPSRFEEHNAGRVSSTKHRIPFKLIYFEGCMNKTDTLQREKYLKTHYGRMFIGNRLKSYFTGQEN